MTIWQKKVVFLFPLSQHDLRGSVFSTIRHQPFSAVAVQLSHGQIGRKKMREGMRRHTCTVEDEEEEEEEEEEEDIPASQACPISCTKEDNEKGKKSVV